MSKEIFKLGDLVEVTAANFLCKFISYDTKLPTKCYVTSVFNKKGGPGVLVNISSVKKATKEQIAKYIAIKMK